MRRGAVVPLDKLVLRSFPSVLAHPFGSGRSETKASPLIMFSLDKS